MSALVPLPLVSLFAYMMCMFIGGYALGLKKGKDEGKIEALKETNQELKSVLEDLDTKGD